MGQQQLLLIILGVIVVGIAVAVGITMFQDNAVSANRDAVANDLINLASKAQQYYRRPTALGGGQGQFIGITMKNLVNTTSTTAWSNPNGSYTIGTPTAGAQGYVDVTGTGTENGNDGATPVEVHVRVWAGRDSVWVVN
jgi:Tfp pilus assembly protein PilE